MTRAVLITVLAILCLTTAPAQAKTRKPLVGLGEQSPWIVNDQRWFSPEKNQHQYVRYLMPWDALRSRSTRDQVD